MRRADREVKERSEIIRIIEKCDSLALAMYDGEFPYVIEMNFGFVDDGEKLTLYFHSAKEGKKLELIRNNPNAAFSMSCSHEVVFGKVPCASTFKYESVCGKGKLSFLEGEERILALQKITQQYDREKLHEFDSRHAAAVTLFKMDVNELTGKRRLTK